MKEPHSIINHNIYVFWTGDNELTQTRIICLEQLRNITECNVILITKYNLNDYILTEHPLHELYNYLSFTHRSDYLRTYFMHFYGGGYSDLKIPTGSWKQAFDDILQDEDILINGYHELPGYNLNGYIGNGAYIVRPNTKFTKEWYEKILQKMDEKLPKFKELGAIYSLNPKPAQQFDVNYPINWEELLGNIFRSVLPKFIETKQILYSVPIPNLEFWSYRDDWVWT